MKKITALTIATLFILSSCGGTPAATSETTQISQAEQTSGTSDLAAPALEAPYQYQGYGDDVLDLRNAVKFTDESGASVTLEPALKSGKTFYADFDFAYAAKACGTTFTSKDHTYTNVGDASDPLMGFKDMYPPAGKEYVFMPVKNGDKLSHAGVGDLTVKDARVRLEVRKTEAGYTGELVSNTFALDGEIVLNGYIRSVNEDDIEHGGEGKIGEYIFAADSTAGMPLAGMYGQVYFMPEERADGFAFMSDGWKIISDSIPSFNSDGSKTVYDEWERLENVIVTDISMGDGGFVRGECTSFFDTIG